MGQTMVTISTDGDFIVHGSHASFEDSDDIDDMPPLVEAEPKEVFISPRKSQGQQHILNLPDENPPLYPTLKLDCSNGKGNKFPDLVETDPSKPKLSEPEPVIYKTLLVKGEKLEISEKVIKEIPYLETLFSGRFQTDCDNEGIVKSEEFEPLLLKAIFRYLEDKKYYKLFACLSEDGDIFELLETFRFLALEPPIETQLSELRKKLSDPPSINVTTQKELVQYAFALFYINDQINWKHERSFRDKVYNTIIYVFKNDNSCFKPRAQYHFKNLVLRCVTLSFNQYQKVKALEVTGNIEKSDDEDDGHWLNCHCGACSDMEDDDMLSMMMSDMWHDPWDPYRHVYDPDYDSDYMFGCDSDFNYCDSSDDSFI